MYVSSLAVQKAAAKPMKLSSFCAQKDGSNLLLNRASTSALLTDPDKHAKVLTVWIPKLCPGLPTGIAQVSAPQSAARLAVPRPSNTGRYLDMNPKQENVRDGVAHWEAANCTGSEYHCWPVSYWQLRRRLRKLPSGRPSPRRNTQLELLNPNFRPTSWPLSPSLTRRCHVASAPTELILFSFAQSLPDMEPLLMIF